MLERKHKRRGYTMRTIEYEGQRLVFGELISMGSGLFFMHQWEDSQKRAGRFRAAIARRVWAGRN